jgi:hypothetical protein
MEFTAYLSEVPSMGRNSGAPPYFTVARAAVREMVAVCGIWFAISSSDMGTVIAQRGGLRLYAGIFAKSSGSDAVAMKRQVRFATTAR